MHFRRDLDDMHQITLPILYSIFVSELCLLEDGLLQELMPVLITNYISGDL